MKLRYVDDAGMVNVIDLYDDNQVLSLGRGSGCNIHYEDPEIAMTHALVIWNQDKLTVKLLPKSKSGIWVDDKFYKCMENEYIDCTSYIQCGKLKVTLVNGDVAVEPSEADEHGVDNVKNHADNCLLDNNQNCKTDSGSRQIKGISLSYVHDGQKKKYVFSEDNPVMLVGSRLYCNVVIKDAAPVQAIVILKNGHLYVQEITREELDNDDMESSEYRRCKTVVDGWGLPPGVEKEIISKLSICHISFQATEIQVTSEKEVSMPVPEKNLVVPEPDPVVQSEEVPKTVKEYTFRIFDEHFKNTGRYFVLNQEHPKITFGRSPECDYCWGFGGVSKYHAVFEMKNDSAFVSFPPGVNPLNGLKVDDIRVKPDMEVEILDNSVIYCGASKLVVQCMDVIATKAKSADDKPEEELEQDSRRSQGDAGDQ